MAGGKAGVPPLEDGLRRDGLRRVVVPGRFLIGIESLGAALEVVAWLQIDRRAGASRYKVVASGFNDPSHYGRRAIRSSFTPAALGAWQAAGAAYRLAVSTWCGPPEGMREAVAWMSRRFAGMRVHATACCEPAQSSAR